MANPKMMAGGCSRLLARGGKEEATWRRLLDDDDDDDDDNDNDAGAEAADAAFDWPGAGSLARGLPGADEGPARWAMFEGGRIDFFWHFNGEMIVPATWRQL